ncbi:hypothetical protein DYBT9275_02698 [Dyadobacter sp. CECT 9275]|uniref:DUF3945 domain-containing protein n=1 Tax=Dyadobacter helix TaxID=2822344 RepID=A0A916JCN6_9BACT|nr:hypothetical protein [Dyadobacter sp. CECT 9275]CAG5001588.1 hypothetical protein DYBT9275_02698 [Dyadobacter sp. CECT 9275]
MNEKNFEYLRDQVKYSGFGDGLEAQLRENIKKQPLEFSVQHQTAFGKDEVTSTLNFKRSSITDMYFFNNYQTSIKPDKSTEKVNQTFYMGKDNNITLKEGYNLISGRAVNKDLTNKEGKIYNAWLEMDFKQTDAAGNFRLKQYHQNYGFDLNKELASLPIKELQNNQDRERIIDSLQKGNRQLVTFLENGTEQRRHIEANPQFKSVTVYDANMHRIYCKQSQQVSRGIANKSEQKPADELVGGEGEYHRAPKKPKKSKSMSISQ